MQFLGNVLVDGFIHRASPVNFGIKLTVLNPQRGGDDQHVKIGDADGASFDLGDGATGGVVPAGQLQLDGKLLLRPAELPTQREDLPPD